MQVSRLSDTSSPSFVLRMEDGEEIVGSILSFAKEYRVGAAEITGIGALSDVVLGFFDLDRRSYHENHVDQQAEIVSLIGNLAEQKGEPKLHAHIAVALRDASMRGGHLLKGHVRPTLELVVNVSPERLKRRSDPETGLALLDLKEPG